MILHVSFQFGSFNFLLVVWLQTHPFEMIDLLEKVITENQSFFCLCSPLLLNNVIDAMVCLIKYVSIFTLYNGDIEEVDPGNFL